MGCSNEDQLYQGNGMYTSSSMIFCECGLGATWNGSKRKVLQLHHWIESLGMQWGEAEEDKNSLGWIRYSW